VKADGAKYVTQEEVVDTLALSRICQ
jgi:hypothetical protein